MPKRYVIFTTASTTLRPDSSNISTTVTEVGLTNITTSDNFVQCPFHPVWIHFGFCDDESNNINCNFDNGECCQELVKTDFCVDCFCHEDNSTHEGVKIYEKIDCFPDLKSDGICDDKNNHKNCDFDGGDCCLDVIYRDRCLLCFCHQDGTFHDSVTGKKFNFLKTFFLGFFGRESWFGVFFLSNTFTTSLLEFFILKCFH